MSKNSLLTELGIGLIGNENSQRVRRVDLKPSLESCDRLKGKLQNDRFCGGTDAVG